MALLLPMADAMPADALGSQEAVVGEQQAGSSKAAASESVKFLLQQRSQNTQFADWLNGLAPGDARKAVLKKADSLASTTTEAQRQELNSILVSDSYGGAATAQMVFKVREAYNTRFLGRTFSSLAYSFNLLNLFDWLFLSQPLPCLAASALQVE